MSNSALACIAGRRTLQRRWEDAGSGAVVWHVAVDGLRWFSKDGLMWFEIADRHQVGDDVAKWEGKQQPHGAWLDMGWGTIGVKAEPKPKLEPSYYPKLVQTGRQRFATATPKGLAAPTQRAREEFFESHYTTETSEGSDGTRVGSRYKHPGKVSTDYPGEYLGNEFNPDAGTMVASHNYALAGGELYYNPAGDPNREWGHPASEVAKMPGAEILFQQWKKAGGEGKALRSLKRSRVSGGANQVVKFVLATANKNKNDEPVFRPSDQDEAFYALLATVNATAAIWLVADHGVELGVKGIESIQVTSNLSLLIRFTPA